MVRGSRNAGLFRVTLHRRGGGDAGEDFIHAQPVCAGGTRGDGGAGRGVIELRGEGGGDEAVHGDVLAGGEVAGLARDGFGAVRCGVSWRGNQRR